MTGTILADTSAWARLSRTPAILERWIEATAAGRLATCAPIRLELLWTARGATDYDDFAEELGELPDLGLRASVLRRAEDVQAALAHRAGHRGPSPVDRLVAATAEVHGATLLHYDRHFDAIVEITGQAAEWLAPRGTLD